METIIRKLYKYRNALFLTGAPNISQQLNLALANSLYYLRTQIERMRDLRNMSLTNTTIDIITEDLKELDKLTTIIMEPLIGYINATIETIIVTIHLEHHWANYQVSTMRRSIYCSPYICECTQFISRI